MMSEQEIQDKIDDFLLDNMSSEEKKEFELLLDKEESVAKQFKLQKMMIDGIKYEKITNDFWEMRRFEDEELEGYLENLVKTQNQNKTLYDYVMVDSNVESDFAKDLDSMENVKFYFKLPNWFKIPTPIGNYNPDWALVFEDDKKIYFVAETKETGTPQVLSG